MNRIGVVGIGWQRGGPELLARFTVPREERGARLPQLARDIGAVEAVYLATCNRVEVAFATDGTAPVAAMRGRIYEALLGAAPAPGEAERALRAWEGEGAAEHLYLVTAGLDSARVGETDIAGQVRDAVDTARRLGVLGPRLEQVFDGALKVAARIHQDTGIGEGRTSLAEVALDAARERLALSPGAVALVGISSMTQRCGRALAQAGVPLVVVNRSLAPAAELAAELGAQAITLETFRASPPPVTAVITATGAPGSVLSRRDLDALIRQAPHRRPPLVIDMAVPPDVDPTDAREAGLPRLDMDAIIARAEANRQERLREMAGARLLVDEGLAELRRQMCDRMLAPLIAELRRRSHATAEEGLARVLRRDLSELSDEQKEAVRRWTRSLVQRMIHVPTVGLRSLAFEAGPQAVEAFLSGADAELAAAVGDLADRAAQLGREEP